MIHTVRKITFFRLFLGWVLMVPLVANGQTLPRLSLGVAVGGSGLLGPEFQYRPTRHLAFDIGIYGRTVHSNVFEPHWYLGPAADFDLSVFILHHDKPEKNKKIYNGLYLKGGIGLSVLQEYMAGFGWVREIHSVNHPGRFVQMQIGPSIRHRVETYLNTRYPPGYQEQSQEWYSAMIYARFIWFFVLSKDT